MSDQEKDIRYPIGKFQPQTFSENQKEAWLTEILFLPRKLEASVLNLDESQLNMPYRDGGWCPRQIIHHLADSHMNAFMRFKLALTEDNPTIKPYNERTWAELNDYSLATNISMTLLHALHNRWYDLLKHMQTDEWNRTFFHPERNLQYTLWATLGLYAWHGNHHIAHINYLREQHGW